MCSPLLFPTHQDGQMNRIGMRIIAMNIRLDVNQSMFLCLESPQESCLLFPLYGVKTM
jgi:hypothetical protein